MLYYFWGMANKRIESLYVDGVGPFSDFTIQFPQKQNLDEAEVHIFTGENGVGKSTLLYCLTAFVDKNIFILPRIPFEASIKIGTNEDKRVRILISSLVKLWRAHVKQIHAFYFQNWLENSKFYEEKNLFLITITH